MIPELHERITELDVCENPDDEGDQDDVVMNSTPRGPVAVESSQSPSVAIVEAVPPVSPSVIRC